MADIPADLAAEPIAAPGVAQGMEIEVPIPAYLQALLVNNPEAQQQYIADVRQREAAERQRIAAALQQQSAVHQAALNTTQQLVLQLAANNTAAAVAAAQNNVVVQQQQQQQQPLPGEQQQQPLPGEQQQQPIPGEQAGGPIDLADEDEVVVVAAGAAGGAGEPNAVAALAPQGNANNTNAPNTNPPQATTNNNNNNNNTTNTSTLANTTYMQSGYIPTTWPSFMEPNGRNGKLYQAYKSARSKTVFGMTLHDISKQMKELNRHVTHKAVLINGFLPNKGWERDIRPFNKAMLEAISGGTNATERNKSALKVQSKVVNHQARVSCTLAVEVDGVDYLRKQIEQLVTRVKSAAEQVGNADEAAAWEREFWTAMGDDNFHTRANPLEDPYSLGIVSDLFYYSQFLLLRKEDGMLRALTAESMEGYDNEILALAALMNPKSMSEAEQAEKWYEAMVNAESNADANVQTLMGQGGSKRSMSQMLSTIVQMATICKTSQGEIDTKAIDYKELTYLHLYKACITMAGMEDGEIERINEDNKSHRLVTDTIRNYKRDRATFAEIRKQKKPKSQVVGAVGGANAAGAASGNKGNKGLAGTKRTATQAGTENIPAPGGGMYPEFLTSPSMSAARHYIEQVVSTSKNPATVQEELYSQFAQRVMGFEPTGKDRAGFLQVIVPTDELTKNRALVYTGDKRARWLEMNPEAALDQAQNKRGRGSFSRGGHQGHYNGQRGGYQGRGGYGGGNRGRGGRGGFNNRGGRGGRGGPVNAVQEPSTSAWSPVAALYGGARQ